MQLSCSPSLYYLLQQLYQQQMVRMDRKRMTRKPTKAVTRTSHPLVVVVSSFISTDTSPWACTLLQSSSSPSSPDKRGTLVALVDIFLAKLWTSRVLVHSEPQMSRSNETGVCFFPHKNSHALLIYGCMHEYEHNQHKTAKYTALASFAGKSVQN